MFDAKRVDRSSYAWTSITVTIKALDRGFGWHIGNGLTPRLG